MRRRSATILLAGAFSLLALSTPQRAELALADGPTTAPVADEDVDLIPTVNMVPVDYRHRLVQQMGLAGDHQQTWLKAIVAALPEHREAMAYLLINMPESDLTSLKADSILKNVELAYKARAASAWAGAIPREIFFRDVLPYANVDETREDWRQSYFDQFMPLVKDAKSPSEAAQILNKQVFKIVNVKYHPTKREKPNQSPSESAKIGYASCTGLSIILSDACRAVGAPARLAGTPLWTVPTGGNHTWTEIWDRQWYFVGAAEPGKLNETWFVDNAAKADETNPLTRIYAASFEQTPTVFPMVWSPRETNVRAVDVTGYYTDRQTLSIKIPAETSVEIRQGEILLAQSPDQTTSFSLAAGQAYAVALIDKNGKTVASQSVTLAKDTSASVDLTGPKK